MRGIAEYEVQMGEIADSVADRTMTPQEGREAIRNLKNPLEGFGKLKPAETPAPEGVEADVWDHMTPEERALFQ